MDDPYDDWRSNAPPGPAPWMLDKQNEHPCVMCGKRVPLYNLGRCKPCNAKVDRPKEASTWDVC